MAAALLLLILVNFVNICSGTRKLSSLYQPPLPLLSYHKGPLLQGDIPISILWYGKFTPSQKSIISDFLLSLTPQPTQHPISSSTPPSVAKWWSTIDYLVQKAGKAKTHIALANQVTDEHCSIGKLLKKPQLTELALKANALSSGVALVLTATDIAVEGFCESACGTHGSIAGSGPAYVWVGNSETQCPGQCAWPFHQPLYGPQSPPLGAPNGDVGVDGMVINVAKLLAGAVTNPFGDGYFQGDAGGHVEVGAACTGVYGKGAYPGYPGELLVDSSSGGSYNAEGINGKKYLVPAMFDPATSSCSPVV
ncbi:protein PHOSPHATE-INDUCED 1-like [Typha angustifolia]|uniref:protein PHOSPHATE-INDUCED 1-like n=1 Tax=Typha angustifolia TaxID=59011 RepID=UPI003C2C8EBE